MEEKYDETTLNTILLSKISLYRKIIKRNYVVTQDYLNMGLLTSSDLVIIHGELDEMLSSIMIIEQTLLQLNVNYDSLIEQLQNINNKLSSLIKSNGTKFFI